KYTDLPGGVTIEHAYDFHGHEVERKYPDVTNYTIVAGSPIPVGTLSRVYHFNYNDLARTAETISPRGFKVKKSLLASGKTRSIVGDCGLSIKYEYDKN